VAHRLEKGKAITIDCVLFPVVRFCAFYKERSNDQCWLWEGYLDKDGYGRFWFDGVSKLAHRVSYAYRVEPIPWGQDVDHLCGNEACINPHHLRLMPRSAHSIYHWQARGSGEDDEPGAVAEPTPGPEGDLAEGEPEYAGAPTDDIPF
jgi:hypothetical protein